MTRERGFFPRNLLLAMAMAFVLIAAPLIGPIPPAAGATKTLTVCASGCVYATIQGAVNAANAGDTVEVRAGTYAESVSISKSITLLGPNWENSPNDASNPATKNPRRVDEATIAPTASRAFYISATDVTIKGFAIDGGKNTMYIDTVSGAKGTLTIENNWFRNSGATSYASRLFLRGNEDSLVFVGNRMEGGAATATDIWLGNAGEDQTVNLDISRNVWLDNKSRAMNVSDDGKAVRSGSISENWVGNSTTGTVGTAEARQAGFTLAGQLGTEAAPLKVSGNTFKNVELFALDYHETAVGYASILNNTVDGYDSMIVGRQTWGAFTVRNDADPAVKFADVTKLTFTGNSFSGRLGNSAALSNTPGGAFNASGNYWGQATDPALVEGLIVGANVTTSPWCTNPGCPAPPPAESPAPRSSSSRSSQDAEAPAPAPTPTPAPSPTSARASLDERERLNAQIRNLPLPAAAVELLLDQLAAVFIDGEAVEPRIVPTDEIAANAEALFGQSNVLSLSPDSQSLLIANLDGPEPVSVDIDNVKIIEIGSIRIALFSIGDSEGERGKSDDGRVVAQATDRIVAVANGLAPGAVFRAFFFSTPTELGTVVADGNGEVVFQGVPPEGTTPGDHTLQLLTSTATGELVEVAIPVIVATPAVVVEESVPAPEENEPESVAQGNDSTFAVPTFVWVIVGVVALLAIITTVILAARSRRA